MKTTPQVSILMPVHNVQAFLPSALDSLLNQSFTDFELIAIDDLSTDASLKILMDYSSKDQRIAIHRNEKKLSLPETLNTGLKLCSASLIARADADDVYEPNRLKVQFELMQNNPKIGVSSSAFYSIDETDQLMEICYVPVHDQDIRFQMQFGNCLVHPAIIYRRNLILSVGGYSEESPWSEEYDLWARLLEKTYFANYPEPLIKKRKHKDSIMSTRGEDGNKRSQSISQRLLSRYVGSDLSDLEIKTILTLYRGWSAVNIEHVRDGITLLNRILTIAKEIEASSVVKSFKNKVGRSLLKQSVFLSGSS